MINPRKDGEQPFAKSFPIIFPLLFFKEKVYPTKDKAIFI